MDHSNLSNHIKNKLTLQQIFILAANLQIIDLPFDNVIHTLLTKFSQNDVSQLNTLNNNELFLLLLNNTLKQSLPVYKETLPPKIVTSV